MICVDNYRARGQHKSERVLSDLEADIRSLVDGQAQADPKFQSTFLYTRISARAVRAALEPSRKPELPAPQYKRRISAALLNNVLASSPSGSKPVEIDSSRNGFFRLPTFSLGSSECHQ